MINPTISSCGTDVKPLERLLFMRDAKSRNYFEQMKGRGTRMQRALAMGFKDYRRRFRRGANLSTRRSANLTATIASEIAI